VKTDEKEEPVYLFAGTDPLTPLYHDPIGERGGINLYAFAGNDSMNMVDVAGLLSVPCKNFHPGNGPWNSADTAAILVLAAAPVAAYVAWDYFLTALGIGALTYTRRHK